MAQIRKIVMLIFWTVLITVSLSAQIKLETPIKDCKPSHMDISASIQHISDIDFVKLEYKMELWLFLETEDRLALNKIENQITIRNTKDLTVDTLPSWKSNVLRKRTRCESDTCNPVYSKQLKINCTMIADWDLDGYPFDRQTLNIIIYNAARDSVYFKISPVADRISYNALDKGNTVKIENGWVFTRELAIVEKNDTFIHDPFNRTITRCSDSLEVDRTYSSIHYSITVWREHRWLLFFKLLIGMYVAFFVAFISLYVNINEAQSRFDLPVGGLFAAIANKYIMESIMPQSPEFSLVDVLHSITIIFILIIIAYSARLLFKFKAASGGDIAGLLKNDNRNIWSILIIYILLNILFIVSALFF